MTSKVTHKASNPAGNTPTALASWMRGLARELEHQGCDAQALFSEAGLDFALLDKHVTQYPKPPCFGKKQWRPLATKPWASRPFGTLPLPPFMPWA
jgi:hypothetical protein